MLYTVRRALVSPRHRLSFDQTSWAAASSRMQPQTRPEVQLDPQYSNRAEEIASKIRNMHFAYEQIVSQIEKSALAN